MINNRRHPVVRTNFEELRPELFALANIDRYDAVIEARFFEKDRNFMTVRRWPVMQINHSSAPLYVAAGYQPNRAEASARQSARCVRYATRHSSHSMATQRASDS